MLFVYKLLQIESRFVQNLTGMPIYSYTDKLHCITLPSPLSGRNHTKKTSVYIPLRS